MCGSHWRAVPKALQLEVWKTYRAGQCDDRLVTYDYLIAARRAVNSVIGRSDDFDPFLQGLIGKREEKENIP